MVKSHFDACNARDIDAAMAPFADDAIFTNPFGVKYIGKTAIRPLCQENIDLGRQLVMSKVQVTGNIVTFHIQRILGGNPNGDFDYEAQVQGDKIISMTVH